MAIATVSTRLVANGLFRERLTVGPPEASAPVEGIKSMCHGVRRTWETLSGKLVERMAPSFKLWHVIPNEVAPPWVPPRCAGTTAQRFQASTVAP
jgi:hypothetical protein